MKLALLSILVLSQTFSLAMANEKCVDEAELNARIFSANENDIPVSNVVVFDSFFHSEENGVLYYAVLLDSGEEVNVGLSKKNCVLKQINYVTND